MQLRLREGHRQDCDFPFPQGCNGLLERPVIDPPVVQQGDQGVFIRARIGYAVNIVLIKLNIAYLIGRPTPYNTQYACLPHILPL